MGIEEPEFCSPKSKYYIQQVPYEHTSSYVSGSAKGPSAIIDASHFVELYDEVIGREVYKSCRGIHTLPALDLQGRTDASAMEYIEKATTELISNKKFVVTLGAEHTVTLGLVSAFRKKYKKISVLQIDAHSDLRESYQGNKFSHASVMKRIADMNVPLVQIGIRAQCKEEADLIRNSKLISTFYAHEIRKNDGWKKQALAALGPDVYITIDADGFDPSVIPAVGTAEPGGLFWEETVDFLRKVIRKRNVVGIDVVEVAPRSGEIISEYTCAKLIYRLIGYLSLKK